jgi:alpha-D-ribose 1-methylphosphonate 5-triphosphate synthase subunit PhnI
MYRAGITDKNGNSTAENFNTKKQAEEWILSHADNIKKSIIVNKEDLTEREITNW